MTRGYGTETTPIVVLDDADAYADELRKRCESAQVFRQVWALVEPVLLASQNAKRLSPIIDAAISAGLVTVARDA